MGDRILVVTGEDELRDFLQAQLSSWGHETLAPPPGGESWSWPGEQPLPLAIVDDQAPGDGLRLLQQIKHDHPWTEVIFLVERQDLERGATSLEFGASDFLVKPLSRSRLGIALGRAQERLSLKRKLAVLAGQPLDDPHAPELEGISELLDQDVTCALRLYDTQQQYQQLFNEVPCYITVLDPQYRLSAINRRFKEDFGYQIGEFCFQVYKHREEACPECPVAATFRDGQSHQFEQIVTALSGEQYNVLTLTAPLRNTRGEITHVMAMSTNITQIRTLQDHLSSLGMVIGSISHGVKGLLTALDGGLYAVRSGLEKNDPQRSRKGWEVVELMVARLRRTVLDVLFYAKERDLDREQVEVAEFAQQVAFTGQTAAAKYRLNFHSRLAGDLGRFWVDPNALNPALINIIENAVDACLEDHGQEQHSITFSVSREDDVIVFDVEDDGLGMDEDTKENMFTLFFTSKGSRGTGLGLFIAHDTVQQHGGSITVDSEPGQGSHFHVRIPVKPPPARVGKPCSA